MYLPQWSTESGPSFSNTYNQQSDRERQNPEGRSHLRRSPIPADPGYGGDYRRISNKRIPRLHGADATANFKRANANEGAPYLLPVRCSHTYDPNIKPGIPQKNYMNENLKRIRRVMRETQKQKLIKDEKSKPIPVKALWHSKKYDNTESKVKKKLDEDMQRSSSRPQSVQGNFLRAHANTGPEYLRSQSVNDLRRTSVSSSVNIPTTQVDKKTKPDYVKINSRFVKTMPKVRKSMSTEAVEEAREKQEKKLKNYQEKQKGQVPDYIEKIKEKRDLDEYEARINAPDPECPPGHVKVDNDQRISTLEQLKQNRTTLEKKLNHLPVRNDSLLIRQTKEGIEKKLVELDQAIEIFSKPKVFIKLDE